MAIGTFELIVTIAASIDMNGATMRTYHNFTPSLFSDEITAAFIRVEMADKRNERIEMCKFKFHSPRYLYYYIP